MWRQKLKFLNNNFFNFQIFMGGKSNFLKLGEPFPSPNPLRTSLGKYDQSKKLAGAWDLWACNIQLILLFLFLVSLLRLNNSCPWYLLMTIVQFLMHDRRWILLKDHICQPFQIILKNFTLPFKRINYLYQILIKIDFDPFKIINYLHQILIKIDSNPPPKFSQNYVLLAPTCNSKIPAPQLVNLSSSSIWIAIFWNYCRKIYQI